MNINLISDTVTQPSKGMLDAMMNAQVGDDVFKTDVSVNELEAKTAALFGKEAALFFPSGTMANQTAIKLHTQPGEQLICDKYAHIYNYEGGGVSFNSGVSCKLIDGHRGMMTAEQVEAAINPPDFYHSPLTTLVCIENTTNKGGGACFSKGLGCPVGSVLVGSKAMMDKALRIRKILGGGMRQAGYLAAAALYALDHNRSRLADDHKKAFEIGVALQNLPFIKKVEPIETNIVIFEIEEGSITEAVFLDKLLEQGISIIGMGQGKLRMVTHLDYTDEMHAVFLKTLKKL